jgi:hypothetical protein
LAGPEQSVAQHLTPADVLCLVVGGIRRLLHSIESDLPSWASDLDGIQTLGVTWIIGHDMRRPMP